MTCRCHGGINGPEHARRYAEQRALDAQRSAERDYREVLERESQALKRMAELSERSPNPDEFKIVDYEQIGDHLVLKVRYPSCARCSYDQCKVMVFLNVTLKQSLAWTRIDPHFREGKAPDLESPSPAARFPGSSDGWGDAIAYAQSKRRPVK
jgi:hypothetical protein